jgi:hypothetical protein
MYIYISIEKSVSPLFNSDDRGSKFVRNVNTCPPNYKLLLLNDNNYRSGNRGELVSHVSGPDNFIFCHSKCCQRVWCVTD